MSDHRVTVVIAAKDEAATIEGIVSRSRLHCGDVIVVDGHSSDATPRLAEAAGARVLTDRGRGKGDALRLAIPYIQTEVTVFIDADGSHDPADIPRLVDPILAGDADHVSGSRLMGGSSELHGGFDEFFRLTGSALITACINWRFGVRLSESQNGFRAIRTVVLRGLDLREDSTTIEQEMIIKTLGLGFRMADVPSHEHRRQFGESHIRIVRAGPRYVYSLIKYLFFCRFRRTAGRLPIAEPPMDRAAGEATVPPMPPRRPLATAVRDESDR